MIQPNAPEDSAVPLFTVSADSVPPVYRPNSNYIHLDYERPHKVGEIIMPNQAKGLEWITAVAIACGPECKVVKPGDKVLLASKGLVSGTNGVLVEGRVAYFTQETMIVAVIVGAE